MEQELIDKTASNESFCAESGSKLLTMALKIRVEQEEAALGSIRLETDQRELLIRKKDNKIANKELIASYKRECLRRQQARDDKAQILSQI